MAVKVQLNVGGRSNSANNFVTFFKSSKFVTALQPNQKFGSFEFV